MLVHESRLLRWDGLFLPEELRVQNFTWGDPVLENVIRTVKNVGVASQSAASIMQEFILKWLKIGNFREILAEQDFATIESRLSEVISQLMIHNVALIGEDEELQRQTATVTGLDDLWREFKDDVAAASQIPKSVLYSAQGGNLNSDGGASADLRNYYDKVSDSQANDLGPNVDYVLDVIGAPHGFSHKDVNYEWVPLWELSETEKAEIRRMDAETDKTYIESQVLEPEEVTLARFGGPGISGEIVVDVEDRRRRRERLDSQPSGNPDEVDETENEDDEGEQDD